MHPVGGRSAAPATPAALSRMPWKGALSGMSVRKTGLALFAAGVTILICLVALVFLGVGLAVIGPS